MKKKRLLKTAEQINEEIENDSNSGSEILYDKDTFQPKPQIPNFKFEKNPKRSIDALNAPVMSSD